MDLGNSVIIFQYKEVQALYGVLKIKGRDLREILYDVFSGIKYALRRLQKVYGLYLLSSEGINSLATEGSPILRVKTGIGY